MALPFRLLTAFGVVLLAGLPAAAQPAIAPPPHLALDEFVREYRRLGLPLPPANAELLRLTSADSPAWLGFPLPPGGWCQVQQYLVGVKTYCHGTSAEQVKTAADALRDVEPDYVAELLCTAAQCRAHGLNEIAQVLYARGLEAIANPVPPKLVDSYGKFGSFKVRVNGWKLHVEDASRSAIHELRHAAFAYWHGKIMAPGSDRREVLRYLQACDLGFHSDVRDLERTVAPRKSKPGTAESLIDDLTEYRTWDGQRGECNPEELHPGEVAYWKLAEMGFDAIPTLLDHINDTRFTRHPPDDRVLAGFRWHLSDSTHIDELAQRLLNKFAGEWLVGTDVEPARAWWEKARRVGEEKWLVDHALAEAPQRGIFGRHSQRPNRVIFLRALGAKYPGRLAEIYRTFLRARPDDWVLDLEGRILAREVAACKLPRAEKVALLEEGATHKVIAHRLAAITALADLDPAALRKQLIATLQWLPPDIEGKHYSGCIEAGVVRLVDKSNDPTCWDALAVTARRASVGLRFELIGQVWQTDTRGQNHPAWRERLRFLVGFLDDGSVRGPTPPRGKEYSASDAGRGSPTLEVRDFAASVLAWELGLEVAPDAADDPLYRFLLRAVVRTVATRELAAKK